MYERGRSCNERVRAVLVGDIMRGWHLPAVEVSGTGYEGVLVFLKRGYW